MAFSQFTVCNCLSLVTTRLYFSQLYAVVVVVVVVFCLVECNTRDFTVISHRKLWSIVRLFLKNDFEISVVYSLETVESLDYHHLFIIEIHIIYRFCFCQFI